MIRECVYAVKIEATSFRDTNGNVYDYKTPREWIDSVWSTDLEAFDAAERCWEMSEHECYDKVSIWALPFRRRLDLWDELDNGGCILNLG